VAGSVLRLAAQSGVPNVSQLNQITLWLRQLDGLRSAA
jgi:hypothetical protein